MCIPHGNMSHTKDATFLEVAKVRLLLLCCRVKSPAYQTYERFAARLLVTRREDVQYFFFFSRRS